MDRSLLDGKSLDELLRHLRWELDHLQSLATNASAHMDAIERLLLERPTATAWFDRFSTEGIPDSIQWCARHWAPAVRLGLNGFTVSRELDQIERREGPLGDRRCCALGDERMRQLWMGWTMRVDNNVVVNG